MAVNGIALAAAATGTVFLWSALHNGSVLSAVRDIISGKQPQGKSGTAGAGVSVTPGEFFTGNPSGSPGVTPSDVSGGSRGANMAIGKLLAAPYGWATGDEWNALVGLWDNESGWSNTIWNGGSHAATLPPGSSGAYGIPQALPYNKMPKAAWPPGYGGSASASAQISWGLQYIRDTYGKPSAAYSFDLSNRGY